MCHVRCRTCRARRTLPRHPDSYQRKPPQCRTPGCKSTTYTVDQYRQRAERGPKAPKPCRCLGYHFPHSSKRGFCMANPSFARLVAEREIQEMFDETVPF